MKRTSLETVFLWSRYQPDRRIDFNGFLWTRPDGGMLIDPMPLSGDELVALRESGGAAWILVTNADHWRATSELADLTGAKVIAPAGERERLGARASEVAQWFDDRSGLPEPIARHLDVAWIEGGKSPREPVLALVQENALFFSDVVRSHVSGRLTLLPDAKLADRARVIAGVRRLAERRPDAILLGDGDCIFRGAAQAYDDFIAGIA